jgi:hypothetical protein
MTALYEKDMTNSWIAQLPHRGDFHIVCKVCDGLGIFFDGAVDAPSSTPINCRHCGAVRGTLGDLRKLSVSGKQDLFEI